MKRGFTVVEFIIFITIIGLLASILIPSFMRARDQALKAEKIARGEIVEVNTNNYKITLLFEKDGVNVYRFTDPDNGRNISYFWVNKELTNKVEEHAKRLRY